MKDTPSVSESIYPEGPLPSWLQTAYLKLVYQLNQQRFPSGILLSGSSGIGKGWLIRQFMQYSACLQPGEDATPCGICNGCSSLLGKCHPDFYTLAPEEAGKEILIDQVRASMDFLMLGTSGRLRIALIEPAEALTLQAANALLKTLEEPPPQTAWVLVSSRAARLPATLRSRCQPVRVLVPDRMNLQHWLEGIGRQPESSPVIPVSEAMDAALGRPLDAWRLLHDESRIRQWQLHLRALRGLLKEPSPFAVIDHFAQCDLKELLPRLQRMLHSAQRFLATGEVDSFAERIDPVALRHFAQQRGLQEVARLVQASLQWQRDLMAPLNPQARLEYIVLQLWGIRRENPLHH